ncbi:MAG TPA: hypothetical protein VFW48_04745 [Solirubrobacterales bacterium]|nr:hypothetical protein [Solirubrobacterales bacterium]
MIGAALAVVALGIALTARPALAAPSPVAPQAQAVEPEEENWEEWEETCEEEECKEEAWEEVEGEDEGGWVQVFDEEEAQKAPTAPTPQAECPLDTVKPKAVFDRDRGKLRLVLHYTADSPTKVGVDFWLKGGKNATRHRSAERRLNETGVLSLGRHIDRQAQDKSGGGVVIVELKAPAAPSNCRSKVTKRLAVGHTEHTVSSGRLARVR